MLWWWKEEEMKPGTPRKAPKVSKPHPKDNFMREYDVIKKNPKNPMQPLQKKRLAP